MQQSCGTLPNIFHINRPREIAPFILLQWEKRLHLRFVLENRAVKFHTMLSVLLTNNTYMHFMTFYGNFTISNYNTRINIRVTIENRIAKRNFQEYAVSCGTRETQISME